MALTTPVVLLMFKRPDTTQRVFDAIARAKPATLLVVGDGPRNEQEAEKVEKTRAIIQQVDWDCKVLTHYSEHNMGCRTRVSSGLDWAFSQVEEAIILEDDCLPAPSFFQYCQTLLEYYRNDERIMLISGDNFQGGQRRTPYSYYFSKYNHIWGWASWRRAWNLYEHEMKTWPEVKRLDLLDSVFDTKQEKLFWSKIFDKMYYKREPDTWDYPWTYTCWIQNGLSILPEVNLVSNIGFGNDATHTKEAVGTYANLPTGDIWEIKHPPYIVRHRAADLYTFDYPFDGAAMRSITNKILLSLSIIKRRMQIMKSTTSNQGIYIEEKEMSIRVIRQNLHKLPSYLLIQRDRLILPKELQHLLKLTELYTMVDYERRKNLWRLVRLLDRNQVSGDLVELGVCNGGTLGVLAYAANHFKLRRLTWGYDSFEGLPEPSARDGQAAYEYSLGKASGKLVSINKCVGSLEVVEELLFEQLKLKPESIRLVKGWFQDTLVQPFNRPIALLHLDGDWYDSVKLCLDKLYDQVAAGGYIVLDDYGYWQGCREAFEDFIKERQIKSVQLQRCGSTQAYFRKD
jgi:hypothetical protein